jgi:hypothetical protein
MNSADMHTLYELDEPIPCQKPFKPAAWMLKRETCWRRRLYCGEALQRIVLTLKIIVMKQMRKLLNLLGGFRISR